jgi:DNA-binding beta-propeller fold protein YncE
MIQYVSPGQMDFIMPSGMGSGQATVTVNNGSQMMTGTTTTGAAGPGMFALNGMGIGEGAMLNASMWQMGPFSTTTNGQPTYVALYATGLDLSAQPTVTIGGMPVDVMWFGNAPDYVGLQQINISLPSGMAGVGRAPVMVTSNGQNSNVTFMHILPTTAMMQGMPGWGQGMMVGENMARGHEMSYMAFNAANNTALVTDESDDVVRVISMTSNTTTATITLPSGSQAHAIAVNTAGNLAAVTLSAKASIAIIDLSQNKVKSIVGTGYYPSRVAFSGSNILVTNSAGGTVSVIDSSTGTTTQTENVGLGASGIAVAGSTAIVANMQAASVSIINLTNYSVSTVSLPVGSRPHEVAMSSQGNKAIVTTPMSNGFLILDLGTKAFTQVGTSTWNGMGPGAVAVNGNTAYIANQMTASVTVADLASGTVVKTFPVDPGPMALAVNSAKNQLLVLAEGTGTLDIVDLTSYGVTARIDAGSTERQGQFTMPLVSTVSPTSAAPGSSFALTITGSGFQGVQGIEFTLTGTGAGGGMMGGGMGSGMGQEDANIKVSNVQVNSVGAQITASVQILAGATSGTRQIRLETNYGEIMGMMTNSLFTVTK